VCDDDDGFEAKGGGDTAAVEGMLANIHGVSSKRKSYKPPRMKMELRIIFCLVLMHSRRTIGSGIRTIMISVAMLIAVVMSVSAPLVVPYH
jgi:hypothetical protein